MQLSRDEKVIAVAIPFSVHVPPVFVPFSPENKSDSQTNPIFLSSFYGDSDITERYTD